MSRTYKRRPYHYFRNPRGRKQALSNRDLNGGRTTTSDGWKEDFYLRHKNLAFIKHCIERGWDVRYPIAQEDGFVYALCYECVVKLEAA